MRLTKHPLPREVDMAALARSLTPAQDRMMREHFRERKNPNAATVAALERKGLVRRAGRHVIPTHLGRRLMAFRPPES